MSWAATSRACHDYSYGGIGVYTWRTPGRFADSLYAMRFTPLFACTLKSVSFWLGGVADGMTGIPSARISIYTSYDGLPDALLATRIIAIDTLLFRPGGPNVADFSDLGLYMEDDFHVVVQRHGTEEDTLILISDAGALGNSRSSVFFDPFGWESVQNGWGNDVNFMMGANMCCTAPTGDANDNGVINAADLIYTVNYIFRSGPEPLPCRPAADVDCDGGVAIDDLIQLVNYLFKSGAPPCDVSDLIAQGFYFCP